MENVMRTVGNGLSSAKQGVANFGYSLYSYGGSGLQKTGRGLTALGSGILSFGSGALRCSWRVTVGLGIPHAACGLGLGYAINMLSGESPEGQRQEGRCFNELNEVFLVTGLAIGLFYQMSQMLLVDRFLVNKTVMVLGCAALLGNAAISQFPNATSRVKDLFTKKADCQANEVQLEEQKSSQENLQLEAPQIAAKKTHASPQIPSDGLIPLNLRIWKITLLNTEVQKASAKALGILLIGTVAQLTTFQAFAK